MNLRKLQDVVYGYLQISFPGVGRHTLLNNTTSYADAEDRIDELFVQAANNARNNAELSHDFQCMEVTLEGVIPSTGAGLSWDAMTDEDEVVRSLRSIKSAFVVQEDGTLTPVNVEKKSLNTKKRWDRQQRRTGGFCNIVDEDRPSKVVHWARKFRTDPANDEDITFVVDGYAGLPGYGTDLSEVIVVSGEHEPDFTGTYHLASVEEFDPEDEEAAHSRYFTLDGLSHEGRTTTYLREILAFNGSTLSWEAVTITAGGTVQLQFSSETGIGDWDLEEGTGTLTTAFVDSEVDLTQTDYFLTTGFNYMQWQTIVELNYLIQRFVPRQEGNLNPPEKLAEMALEKLIRDDTNAVESGYSEVRDDA